MRKILLLIGLGILFSGMQAQASITGFESGPYLGVQGGWAKADEGDGWREKLNSLYDANKDVYATKDISEGGFVGGRAYGGYSFTPYFSIEAGYDAFPDNHYKGTGSGIEPYNWDLGVKTFAIDAVIKGILPLEVLSRQLKSFDLYAKAGGALVETTIKNHNDGNSSDTTRSAIRPTYGAGLVYNFDSNFAFDLSWTGILGADRVTETEVQKNVSSKPIPTTNLFSVGITYKITGLF